MKRRQVIAMCGGAALAGCSGQTEPGTGDEGPTPTKTEQATSTPDTEAETTSESPTDTSEPAEFELVEYEFPEQVEIDEQFTPAITIQNSGEQASEYEAPLWVTVAGGNEWQEVGQWEWSTVEPGEKDTAGASGPWSFEYLYELEFRLGEFDQTTSLDVVTKQLSIGQEYTTPWDTQIVVQSIELTEQYTYEDHNGETRPKDAPDGKQWAFAELRAENTADKIAELPTKFDMLLLADNRQYEYEIITDREGAYEGGDVQPGVVEEGWLGFEIPADVTADSLAFVYSPITSEGELAIRWAK